MSNLQLHIKRNWKLEFLVNHLKFFDHKFEEILSDCKDVIEVFSKISQIISFFNYDIIKILTSKFGSETNKKKLKKYRKRFQDYSKRRICECPADAFGNKEASDEAQSKYYVLKIDKSMDGYTVEELEILQYKINKILKQFLRLLHFDKGCIELTFKGYGDDILILTEEEQQQLRDMDIINICHQDKNYDLKALQPRFAKPGVYLVLLIPCLTF